MKLKENDRNDKQILKRNELMEFMKINGIHEN